MFDLEKAFKKSELTRKEFEKIKQVVRKEFPNNPALYELHVLRYLQSLEKKTTKK